MDSPPRDAPRAPLTRAQGNDVLRYWLQALRLNEALVARPQARRGPTQYEPPRFDTPMPGQEYFKLGFSRELGALVAHEEALFQPMDAELSRFFEAWLHTQYRRSQEESELSHLLCFPVVHLPRGELAGLLRMGVRLAFGNHNGPPLRVPSRIERQQQVYPTAPDEVRVTSLPRPDEQWPFFVDARLLHHPLGVPSESVDAFFDALRALDGVSATQQLALMVALLETSARVEPCADALELSRLSTALVRVDIDTLLTRLTQAMHSLLDRTGARARVYPVGIVVDGNQAKTTWHLQRDLQVLLEEEAPWSLDSALGSYLTGRPGADCEGVQRALFDGPSLTTQQRAVAQRFWGAELSAVQGPPGTGKTTLILHLCAEALVRQVDAFIDHGRFEEALFVVVSSNNRAVDNVLDPLTQDPRLPLALRAGNRQVCEQTLAALLRRTLSFLQEAECESAEQRREALARASEHFRQVRENLDHLYAPRRNVQRQKTEHARLREELAKRTHAETAARAAAKKSDAKALGPHAQALLAALSALEKRLLALSNLCAQTPGLMQVNAVARHFGRTAGRELPAFEAALAGANLTLDLPLPPLVASTKVAKMMAAWDEATELSLAHLAELRERLERELALQTLSVEIAQLRRALEDLGTVPDLVPEVPRDDALSRAIFHAAVGVREAWARFNASELRAAVEAALQVVTDERSLRPLFRNDPQSASLLLRLFGIWGSTLLSLGNCFLPEFGSIAQVVIDEAGQCHPAHAVSALLRAQRALVLGDVHQLAPVVDVVPDDEARLLSSCRLKTPPSLLLPYRVHSEAWTSAQTLAERAVSVRGRLTDHFRCQPEIIAVSDALCGYELTVHTPREQRQELPFLRHPIMCMDLQGEQERQGGSLCNMLELRRTMELVRVILRAGVAPRDLAVITPYRGQLERMHRAFADQGIPTEFSGELAEDSSIAPRVSHGVALGTVHRFQGGERSIVLFSSVITRAASLPFLNARPNLLNVAISRAQHHFVCLGHREVLARGERTRLLIDAAHALDVGLGRGADQMPVPAPNPDKPSHPQSLTGRSRSA